MKYQIALFNRSGERTIVNVVALFLTLVVAGSRTTAFMIKSDNMVNNVQPPFDAGKLNYRSEHNVAFEPPTTRTGTSRTTTATTTTMVEQIATKKDNSAIPQAMNFEEYHTHVSDESDRLVVVRFHSPYCKACHAIKPRYNRFLSKYPSVKFVDVPVSSDNAEIHESLGIESLPHGAIYHPGQGLVESSKMNTNVIRFFEKIIKSYVQESCPLPDFNEDTQRYDSPYPRGMFIKSKMRTVTP